MKPYFDTLPNFINCRPDERDRIKELLAVIPEELLTDDTIQAINNGDPVKLYTQPTTAKYRHAQHPLIQACYRDNILEYITTDEYARTLTSDDNHLRWLKRYESRCVINGKVCSPHISCEKCKYKDKKKALLSSLDDYRQDQLAAESVQRTSRGGYKAFNHSDPTADAAIRNVEQDALLDFLTDAGENYAKEYVLRKHGYQNKEIAALLRRSAASVSRDFKTVDKLVDAFYADWNS